MLYEVITLLDRMWLVGRAETGERHHLAVADGGDWCRAGADCLTVEMDGAGAALREATSEMRIVEAEIVA